MRSWRYERGEESEEEEEEEREDDDDQEMKIEDIKDEEEQEEEAYREAKEWTSIVPGWGDGTLMIEVLELSISKPRIII